MPVSLIVGAQWGDEGKGKVIDLLASSADVVARFQGGSNAGHSVHVGPEKYVFHLLPSGLLYDGTLNIIGNGVVVDPVRLVEEIEHFESRGIKVRDRLLLSDLAHVTLAYHKRLDEENEKKRGANKIGTTHQGIGPTYADKYGRVGIKVGDLLDEPALIAKVRRNLAEKNALFTTYYGTTPMTEDEVLEPVRGTIKALSGVIGDTGARMREAVKAGKRVLLEGAQGTLLDVDFGTYPYVTASHLVAGGAFAGTGLPPVPLDRIIGVAKAYTTRVGAGPFPTELPADQVEAMRTRGKEFGATTGRPRRVGWFDALAVRRAADVNGLTELAVTKLDILDHLDEIPVCTGYAVNGATLSSFPNRTEIVEACTPVYRILPGWKSDTSTIRRWDDLPAKARAYLKTIEELAGVRISLLSIGPKRDETLEVPKTS